MACSIARLARCTGIWFARTHHLVEPWSRDTPIGFLIRPHVVIVVPGQMSACPVGIEVRAFVNVVISGRAVPHGSREERRNRKQWQMGGGKHGDSQRLFPLGMPAPDRALVVRIAKAMTPRKPVVVMPMKAPQAALVPAEPVKHVAMNEPFAGVRVQKAEWQPDHALIILGFDLEDRLGCAIAAPPSKFRVWSHC